MNVSPRFAPVTSSAMWPPSTVRQFLTQYLHYFRDPRFWFVQVLVIVATLIHWNEDLTNLQSSEFSQVLMVTMFSCYLIPVIYAALHFGRAGAIPTALWAALLATPNLVFWHRGYDLLSDGVLQFTIIALAFVVSSRVERTLASQRLAEKEILRRRISEAKYRKLFEAAGEAILVVEQDGTIQEANLAAAAFFGTTLHSINGQSLEALVGADNVRWLMQSPGGLEQHQAAKALMSHDGLTKWVEPIRSTI